MSTRKTKIDINTVKTFIEINFSKSVSNLEELNGGEMSYPVAFTANNENYVIRIDPFLQSYLKDKYAWEHFSSIKLPIPEMVKLGKFDDSNYFAVTKRLPGKMLDTFTPDKTYRIIPSLISVLDEIHMTDISDKAGYGYLDGLGKAKFSRWKDYVLSVNERHEEWRNKFPQIKNYVGIFDELYKMIRKLSKYCPEERSLLHGDYGYNNALSDGEKITGVLDWGESRYGDFLFDVAWLDTWQKNINYAEIFMKHYTDKNWDISGYEERINCYKLMNYYGGLEFYVESNQSDKIDWLKSEISELLSNQFP